jgi:hypothetical protein
MKIPHDDPDILWIASDAPPGGYGSYERPFSSIDEGLARIKPGQSLVVRPGEYGSDVNFQISGTARNPIRIMAEPERDVVIRSACWFFYDTSDLVVSGFTFADAPYGAISVIGSCSRNRFDTLSFVNCGNRRQTACTLYLGGAGGSCNVVENCTFDHAPAGPSQKLSADNASVGLMIAPGNAATGDPIVNTLIRGNRFVNYGYGILVGGEATRSSRCGHIIEYNRLSMCSIEGIMVKSGDSLIRGNCIERCAANAVSVHSELDCQIENNRIVDSGRGIRVFGRGHTIANNCLVRCSAGAIHIGGDSEERVSAASNCFVERNTIVECGTLAVEGALPVAGVIINPGTTGIMQQNLVYGNGSPYAVVSVASGEQELAGTVRETRFVIRDNGAGGGCSLLDGVGEAAVVFTDAAGGDYGNSSGFGADGAMLSPEGFNCDAETADEAEAYRTASVLEDEQGNLIVPGEENRRELFSDFFGEEAEV